MILPTMTPEEVYKEIDKDTIALSEWWSYQRKFMIRIAKVTTWKFPFSKWFEYQSPRHNRYLVKSTTFGRNYNNESITGVFALVKMERGYAIYFTRFLWQMVANKVVILPHVFDRYADPKRGNVQKTGIDLVKYYVDRNVYGEPTRNQRFSGRSVRYKGRDNVCLSIHDGVLLGEEIDDIFVAHTFITYDMASGLQREEFEKNKEKILPIKEMRQEIKNVYNYKFT